MDFHKLLGWFAAIPTELRAPLAISLGAIPGALCRYYLTLLGVHWFGTGFPVGTFCINLSGAFLMGFFVTLTLNQVLSSPELRLLVVVGFLGSYTTFSTYALDASLLLRQGDWLKTLFYWAGSAVLGLLCLRLGSFLARRWVG
jgi:fluoride exporter